MTGPEDTRTISFTALRRARTTLEDFTLSYFPYIQGLSPDAPHDLLRVLDVMVWLEATIYQLDEDNEACVQQHMAHATPPMPRLPPPPLSVPGSVVHDVLDRNGWMDEHVLAALAEGDAYWAGERRALSDLSLPELLTIHEAKSFDYRLLHAVLRRVVESPPPPPGLLEFLRVDELLVDIGDDLHDYEDDVEGGSFNILRGYVALFGDDAPRRLAERISGLEAAHGRLLAGLPEELRQHYWKRHKEAAGGDEGGGTRWEFPPLILDEAAWRADLSSSPGNAETNPRNCSQPQHRKTTRVPHPGTWVARRQTAAAGARWWPCRC